MLISYISTQDIQQIRKLVWQYAMPKTYRRYLKFFLIVFPLTYLIGIFYIGIPQLLHKQKTFWFIYTMINVIGIIIVILNLRRDFKRGFLKHTKSGYYTAWVDLSPDQDPKTSFIATMKQHPELLELYDQNQGELYLSNKPGDDDYDIKKDPIFKNLQSNPVLIHPPFKRYESFINTHQYYIFVICVPHTKKQIYTRYQYLIFKKSRLNQAALSAYLTAVEQITDNYCNLENK
ncbi:hypothetical protein [Bombilactobacillus bombi]|uniref:hypothetical protein n=1 Tax=Bombilactobacillus bombi TaxID=1303590 RepID=UPI0015E5C6EC|nr:hypothetical protein [Bombilactobacillus bombi]MBA1435190.1 hypothetical protein [Bombilactobacillus bombi]